MARGHNKNRQCPRGIVVNNLLNKGENMFTLDHTIDTVKNGAITMTDVIQQGTKQIIKNVVLNETHAQSMNNIVDSHTEYTTKVISTGFESTKNMLNMAVDYFNESLKFTQPIKTK